MIVAISAGLSDGSATTRLASTLAEEAAAHLDSAIEVVELRPYARDIADALVTGFPSERLEEVFAKMASAEAIVAATPVYNALPSGLFVEFFDVVPENLLDGKPVAIGATGGSPRHSLVTEQAIRPMFVYLHAEVPTTAVYAATEDWGAPGVGFDGESGRSLYSRIAREGRQFAALARGAASGDAATGEPRRAGAGESAVGERGRDVAGEAEAAAPGRAGAEEHEVAGPRQGGAGAFEVGEDGRAGAEDPAAAEPDSLTAAEAEFPDFVPFDKLLARS